MAQNVYKPEFIIVDDADDMARNALSDLDRVINEDPVAARIALAELPTINSVAEAGAKVTNQNQLRDKFIGSLAKVFANKHDGYLGFDPHTEAVYMRAMPTSPEAKRYNRISLYVGTLAAWTEQAPKSIEKPA